MIRLLLTRPSGDSLELKTTLEAKGFECFVEPLLTVHYYGDDAERMTRALSQKPDVILITSRHAVQALAHATADREAPLAVVGDASTEQARALGFGIALSAPTIKELLAAIRTRIPPFRRLLYARGESVTVDVASALKDRFAVDSLTLYRARKADAFSPELRSLLDKQTLDGALFFSQRTAEAYAELVLESAKTVSHADMRAFCLSPKIAAALSGLSWQSLHVAERPDTPHIVSAVERAFESVENG